MRFYINCLHCYLRISLRKCVTENPTFPLTKSNLHAEEKATERRWSLVEMHYQTILLIVATQKLNANKNQV